MFAQDPFRQHAVAVSSDERKEVVQCCLVFQHLRQDTSDHAMDVGRSIVVEPEQTVRPALAGLVCRSCAVSKEGVIACYPKGGSFTASAFVSMEHDRTASRQVHAMFLNQLPKLVVRRHLPIILPELCKNGLFSRRVWLMKADHDMPAVETGEELAPASQTDDIEAPHVANTR